MTKLEIGSQATKSSGVEIVYVERKNGQPTGKRQRMVASPAQAAKIVRLNERKPKR